MELLSHFVWPCACAFLACAGFCPLYNIRGFGVVLCSLGGALGWMVYLITEYAGASKTVASLIAGLSIAAYAEIMARIRKCPASSYLLLAFFPLVPGAGVYYTMEAYFQGDTERFVIVGRETVSVAGGLAIGVLLVSSLVRMLNHILKRRRERHGPL